MISYRKGNKISAYAQQGDLLLVECGEFGNFAEMKEQLKIYCVNTGEYEDIDGGETLSEISERLGDKLSIQPVCAYVNNCNQDLSFRVFAPKQVEYLDRTSPAGSRVYMRSLVMLLYRAVKAVVAEARLKVEHSIARGLYCRLLYSDGRTMPVSASMVAQLRQSMREFVSADLPLCRSERLSKDVAECFRRQDMPDKICLLDTLHSLYTVFYTLDGVYDSFPCPLVPSTGILSVFNLVPYKEGLLLLGPSNENPLIAAEPEEQRKMYMAFTEYMRFNRVIGVSDVGQLNRAVQQQRTAMLINVAEALHSKLLGRISDRIAERGSRIVLIAGPSSSGKTTTAKRLGIQLMTNMLTPKVISLDDYFVDRALTPRDADGELDYESLYALDLKRLQSDLSALLRGEEINLPTYSFELGCRVEKPRPMRLNPGEVLLIEGIHGLNPELTASLPQTELFKIYVSALTTLSIDDHNWIPTTDNRLLRRIVRDFKYRHTCALDTIRRWPSVRRGEQKWIFPYQENADAMFNSSLIFELGVMRDYALPVLRQVPHDVPEYAEAYRLIRFLEYFEPIPADQIPATSLLREFLGGSAFKY